MGTLDVQRLCKQGLHLAEDAYHGHDLAHNLGTTRLARVPISQQGQGVQLRLGLPEQREQHRLAMKRRMREGLVTAQRRLQRLGKTTAFVETSQNTKSGQVALHPHKREGHTSREARKKDEALSHDSLQRLGSSTNRIELNSRVRVIETHKPVN